MSDIEVILERKAGECGFSAFGITTADVFSDEKRFLYQREQREIPAHPFEWSVLNERFEPKRSLATCKSIVAVAIPYPNPAASSSPRSLPLSVFASYTDYHILVKRRLDLLGSCLKERFPDSNYLIQVDDGPLSERAVAKRAGLGFPGKNSLLLTRKHGSQVFLGILLTDVPLSPSTVRELPLCGSCHRCIEACPTRCLHPWELDHRNCLSSISQLPGIIDRRLRTKMNNLVGCEICQQVCRFNDSPDMNEDTSFDPIAGLSLLSLSDILKTSRSALLKLFALSAIGWLDMRIIQRNALIVLANQGDENDLEAIRPFKEENDSLLRLHALWACFRIAQRYPSRLGEITFLLESQLDRENDPIVRADLIQSIVELKTSGSRIEFSR